MLRANPSTKELEHLDSAGKVTWSQRIDGRDADTVLPVHGSDDGIVLLRRDPSGYEPLQNLVRVAGDGSVRWRAELPPDEGADAFVAVEWEGDRLVANTWSCYRVQLDPNTGRILDQVFTK